MTPHKISEEELVEKLKLVAKGEPKGKPTFRMPIPEAMMSREIKEFDAYLNYMAKYLNAQSGSLTLGRGQGKGYMRKGVLEVNAPKKKKAGVPRRSRTIIIADNLLEDPDQALELDASINLEDNQQRDSERISKAKHATLLLLNLKRGSKKAKDNDSKEFIKTQGRRRQEMTMMTLIKILITGDANDYSDINFDAKEDQTAGFRILEDYNKFLNEPHEVEMFEQLNEPMYTETQTLIVVPLLETGVGILVRDKEPSTLTVYRLLETILQVQEQAPIDQVMNYLPVATTTITPPTKSKMKRANKLLKKAIQRSIILKSLKTQSKIICQNLCHKHPIRLCSPLDLERKDLDVIKKNPVNLFQSSFIPSVDTTEYELKHQLYEKMFETNTYLTHKKHHTLYGALQESMQVDELQARYGSAKPSRKN
ncbi:hypothetical protein Tco_1361415 [Tanacetum coccineum]